LRRIAPYNEWGKEGKFAPRRYQAGDLCRGRQVPNPFERSLSAASRALVSAQVDLLKSWAWTKG